MADQQSLAVDERELADGDGGRTIAMPGGSEMSSRELIATNRSASDRRVKNACDASSDGNAGNNAQVQLSGAADARRCTDDAATSAGWIGGLLASAWTDSLRHERIFGQVAQRTGRYGQVGAENEGGRSRPTHPSGSATPLRGSKTHDERSWTRQRALASCATHKDLRDASARVLRRP